MSFNVTGVEVASGAFDPSAMFAIVGGILLVGFILYIVYFFYSK
jgi:hypothetical protein